MRFLLVWFGFVPVAILNGIVRENFYGRMVGELLAHQISTVIASVAFILLAFVLLRNEVIGLSKGRLMVMGLVWVVMTILFEFGFGHYVVGHSWDKLVMDYDLTKGRVWSLFLLSSWLTPMIVRCLSKNEADFRDY